MEIKNIPQILEQELPEIVKKIALDNNIAIYIKDSDFLEERIKSWHQFGLLGHTKKVRLVFLDELNEFLEKLKAKEKVEEVFEEEIDGVKKRILFEISIPLHDLGKILVYNDKRTDREHELVSKQLIEQGFLKEKLKDFGLSENHLKYIEKIIETHDVLGKQLRDILKHENKLRLDYINENVEEIKNLCKEIVEKYPDIKTELGIFFFCDLLGKTDVRIGADNDLELKNKEKEIDDILRIKVLSPQLKKAIMQLPINMKLTEIYFRVICDKKMQNIQKHFSEPILETIKLEHKGNNQLFKITTDKKSYLLKKYSTIQKDNWNRGKTEFNALSHLWNLGFRQIPEPIKFIDAENIGIYSFEKGKRIEQEQVNEQDIISIAVFLAKLHNIKEKNKKDFPLERTNCLCIFDYLKLISQRIHSISEDFNASEESEIFWKTQIIPKYHELRKSVLNKDIDLNKELSLNEQVITPGDFGFHNMLKDGENYTFLDFEFCGRDDSVKQILDFLHHDRTLNLDKNLKNLFINTYLENTNHPEAFDQRLKLVDDLIGMNWVLIYLNPLSKNYQEHLKFSQPDVDIESLIKERIQKAQNKLNNLKFFI